MPTNSAEYDRRWYSKNKEKHRATVAARQKRMRQWFVELKSGLTCEHCEESDPICLDFHHRDPYTKDKAVSFGVVNGWSKERLLSEIEKCQVLCANCHRKEHVRLQSISGDAPVL